MLLTRYSPGKAARAGSTPAHGFSLALKKQASMTTCGTAIGTRSALGWLWRGQASRKFRKQPATRRSRCRPGIAIFHPRTDCRSWSGLRLDRNRLRDSPEIRPCAFAAGANTKGSRPLYTRLISTLKAQRSRLPGDFVSDSMSALVCWQQLRMMYRSADSLSSRRDRCRDGND